MSLDTLYGVGSVAAFKTCCDISSKFPNVTATNTETNMADGGVYVETVWKNNKGERVGICKQSFYPKRVHYGYLWVIPASRGKGLFRTMIIRTQAWGRSVGILVATSEPESPRAQYILELAGYQHITWNGKPYFGVLLAVGERMEKYRAWVAAGEPVGQAPAWYTKLLEHPVAGEELF